MTNKQTFFLASCVAMMGLHCVPTNIKNSAKQTDSSVSESVRDLIYKNDSIKNINFEMNYEKKAFDFQNNFWMSYFAALQYSHFSVVAQQLESLGFGEKGEAKLYLKRWYELRLAKVFAGVQDTDDSWASDDQRAKRLKLILTEYLRDFPKDADTKPKSVEEAKRNIVGVHDDGRKISFISGNYYFDKTQKTQGTTQLFYAEHRSLPLAIIAFRGTEKGERLDALVDLVTIQATIPSQPAKMMAGFMAALFEVDSELNELLKLRESKNPNLRLMVTGHSLGGAIATAFGGRFLDLQHNGSFKNLKLAGIYTLGSPRVGDDVFAARFDLWFQQHEIPMIRIRNHKDLVTGIPMGLPGTGGYWHVGSLVYYDAHGEIHHSDSENGWSAIDNKSDIGQSFPTDLKDHNVDAYVENARRALVKAGSQNIQKCTSNCIDKVPLPYFEKPEFRKKTMEQLSKEYGN